MVTDPGAACSSDFSGRLQAWQRLAWAETNQATTCYLQGCAIIVLARSPQQAAAAWHETHAALLRHSARVLAGAVRLWSEQ